MRSKSRKQALQDALVLIDSWLPRGDLEGNGTDKNAQRNGMILAYNLVFALANGQEHELGPHADEHSPKPLRDTVSETATPVFEGANLQDAPRVLRNTFTIQHDGKRADVVFASFAACIEREANSLRANRTETKCSTEIAAICELDGCRALRTETGDKA